MRALSALNDGMLKERQRRFADEYCVDFNATQAYLRVYGPDVTLQSAGVLASKLLDNVSVQERVEERKMELAAKAELTTDWLVNQFKMIASANPNELIELRTKPCSNCWATEDLIETYEFLGLNVKRDPCPECESCQGVGIYFTVPKDTRKLSLAGRRLYKGVKQTKDGLQVLMHDQQAALKWLSDYMGVAPIRSEISGPGGAPLAHVAVGPEDLSDEQLAIIASQRVS